MSTAPTEMPRPDWWREYAAWQLGHREGPLCVRCGVTISADRVIPSCLCTECEEAES